MTNREFVEMIGDSQDAWGDALKAYQFQVEGSNEDDFHDWIVWLLEND